MICITDKGRCCGCSACMQRCPKHCISLQEDEQGFLYPKVDEEMCIDCGLCEKTCPVINQSEPKEPLFTFAAKNPNEEIRMRSSSGGIFTALAEKIINDGGVVFGARFNNKWEVIHDFTEVIEGLVAFRGSKYVQSRIDNCFSRAEQFLRQGRKVLFSGTPCQIAGLNKFLRKSYENLLTVDVICHGVPSPLVWRKYVETLICPKGDVRKKMVLFSQKKMPVITNISFRDKSTGWKKYSFVVRVKSGTEAATNSVLSSDSSQESVLLHERLDKNVFMRGFLANLYLRPSCYACAAKSGKSGSDITIGDFWGIGNYYFKLDDDKGVGLILVNTGKGRLLYNSIETSSIEVNYLQAVEGNSAIIKSVAEPKLYNEFWNRYLIFGNQAMVDIIQKMRPSTFMRLLNFTRRLFKLIIRRK